MMDLQVELGFFPRQHSRPYEIPALCWTAREILGAFMTEPVELDVDDCTVLALAQECADAADDELDGETTQSSSENESTLHAYLTPSLFVSNNLCASLSNVPSIEDNEGRLTPLLEPGYVSLWIEPANNAAVDCNLHQGNQHDQYIFRLPNPGRKEDAAIFHGFSVDEEDALISGQVSTLKKLERLMSCMRRGYQYLVENDAQYWSANYWSTEPVEPIAEFLIAAALKQL